MSAQALLSMIAPALPATPQGSPAGDAMAFQGLLAAMIDVETASAPDTDVAPADPATDQAASAAAVMVAAPPPPSPVVLVAGLAVAPANDDGASASAATPPVEAEVAADPAPLEVPAKAKDVEGGAQAQNGAEARTDAGAPAQALLADEAAALLTAAQPAGAKAVSDLAPSPAADRSATVKAAPAPLVAPLAPPAADKPGADIAAPPAAEVEAAPAPTSAPTPAQTATAPVPTLAAQAAPPPPLRALAERTSRPLDTAPSDGAPVVDPRASAPAAAVPVASSDGSPAGPSKAVEAPPAVAGDAVGVGTSDEPAPEPLPAETASAAPAAHTAREAVAPTLSRAAIDATAQIAAQILKKLDGRATRFEMALTPDELGRVDAKLDIDAEGRLSARLAFDNPAAAADLRGRADDLRRELQQAGFHVADDAFEFAERDSGSSAFDRGPSDDARDDQARAFARASRLNTDADAALLAPRWTPLALSPSGVDLKV